MQREAEITRPIYSSFSERLLAAGGVLSLVGGSAMVAYFDPNKANLFPVCPLFTLTGFACPGCGLTRGFHALFHGDIVTAIDFNAMVPIWAVIIAWVFVSLLLLTVRGAGLKMWPTNPRFLWVMMIGMVIFSVLRNIPVYPLTILFP